jgi:hypothetical protein
MTFDIESLLASVESFTKANLHPKLDAISSEKGDGLVLKPIADKAYFIQTLNEQVANYDPYVYIGITDPPQVSVNGPAIARTYTVNVALVIADSGQDRSLWKRLSRYQRAFEEIFRDGWGRTGGGQRLTAEGYIFPLPPEERKQQVGVILKVTIV